MKTDQQWLRARTPGIARLRLVHSVRTPVPPLSAARMTNARFARLLAIRRPSAGRLQPVAIPRRPAMAVSSRTEKGIIMKTLQRLIDLVSRFAVGLGSALALVCAVVIVSSGPTLGPEAVVHADVVRLDPVVVTISSERFAQIRAEEHEQAMFARSRGHKPNEV